MNPGSYYVPNMNLGVSPMMGMRMGAMAPRNMGLFGRLASGIRSINFGNILNGANKTLNVVNQTIPLIKQAKPMVNNMRSMFKLAKAFGNVTVNKETSNNNISSNKNDNLLKKEVEKSEINRPDVISSSNNYPNFFI